MPKDTPGKLRGGARAERKLRVKELRLPSGAVKSFNKEQRDMKRAGKRLDQLKVSSSSVNPDRKTNSARKPSVAKAALKGAKNKMKAQGAKAQSAPTARYKQGMRNK